MGDFSQYLIEKKKQLVLETVSKVCKKIGLPTLPVNFDGCPQETEDHLAHIHPDTNVICISEFQLHKLNYDDIKHTVVHEITHVFAHGHGGDFQGILGEIGRDTWEPPDGVIVIKGQSSSQDLDENSSNKKTKTKKKSNEPELPSEFDPYEYCTHEFNQIYGTLIMRIGSPSSLMKLRHENLQLVDDDWKSDLVKHLERKHEELMSGLGSKGPKQIFDWAVSIKEWLEQYNHWYWEAADEFFVGVCNSSLPNYFSDAEVEQAMNKINSKLAEHVNRLKEDIATTTKELEKVGMMKNKANTELVAIHGDIRKEQEELADLQKQQIALRKEIGQLYKDLQEKQDSFHKELKKKYDEIEDKLKDGIKDLETEKKDKEKELNKVVERNRIARFIDSLIGGKKK